MIGVPTSWAPDQIKQFQDYWDTEFAGDLAKRRRAKFVPGEAAAKVVQTKEPAHKDDFDEWLARIICYAFSVPPQWAVKLMNRATADNQSAQAEDEGLEPTKEWVKDLIDEIIAEEFASPDLELAWLDEDEADPKGMEAVLEGRVKLGAVTLNEMRDALGLDPYANTAADRAMVLTATGYVPIEAGLGGEVSNKGESNAARQNAGALPETEHGIHNDIREQSGDKTHLKASPDDPKHPGWPARTPGGIGGQFRPKDKTSGPTPGGGSPDTSGNQIRYQKYGRGHHWVPREVFENREFKPETEAVFENATSGPLANPKVNSNTVEHVEYNLAVDELLEVYLKRNDITEQQMTPEQADDFIYEVRRSADTRIRGFNLKIIRERLRYIGVYGRGRWGGDED